MIVTVFVWRSHQPESNPRQTPHCATLWLHDDWRCRESAASRTRVSTRGTPPPLHSTRSSAPLHQRLRFSLVVSDGFFTLQDSGIVVTACQLGNMWARFLILLTIKPVASYIAYLILRNRM